PAIGRNEPQRHRGHREKKHRERQREFSLMASSPEDKLSLPYSVLLLSVSSVSLWFVSSGLLTRKLSESARLLKGPGQTYSIEGRCSMTKLFDLTGKTALVTGGNGGIGLGIARGLAQAGARVAIIARNTAKSHAAAKALAEETGIAPLVLTA